MTIWIGIDKSIMYNCIKDPLSSCHQSQAHRAHANLVAPQPHPYKRISQVHPLERGGAEQLRVRQRWEGALPRDVGPGRSGPCLERHALLFRNLLHLSSLGQLQDFFVLFKLNMQKYLFLWDIAHLLSLVNSLVTPIHIKNNVQLNQLNISY